MICCPPDRLLQISLKIHRTHMHKQIDMSETSESRNDRNRQIAEAQGIPRAIRRA